MAIVTALGLVAACAELQTAEHEAAGAGNGAAAGLVPGTGNSVPSDRTGAADRPDAAPAIPSAASAADGKGAAAGDAGPTLVPGTGRFVRQPKADDGAKINERGEVTLNFVDADVREVAKSVLGNILKLNYLIDPQVRGEVTVQTSRPLPRADILPALETVLRSAGASIVNTGSLYKIVPTQEAPRQAGGIRVGRTLSQRQQGFGIQIIPLRYVAAAEMAKIIEPLAPKGNILRIDETRNLLVVAATRLDMSTMLDAVHIFDVDLMGGMSFGLFPLEFADAKTLSEELAKVFGGGRGGKQKRATLLRFVPIERLNAVLVITPQAKYLERAGDWIERLDRGGDTGSRRLAVYKIKNSKAADLAEILESLFSSQGRSGAFAAGEVAPRLAAAEVRAAARNALAQGANSARQDPNSPQSLAADARDFTLAGGGEVRIIADEANNALVVLAAPSDHNLIKSALKKLDIVPLQVLIEATIAEVTLNDKLEYGLQWFFKEHAAEFSLTNLVSGAVNPVFPGFSFLFGGGDIRVALSALKKITDVNIISSPQLMVLGNQTATLQVGDQVPIATQSAVSVTDPAAPIVNNIEFRDTGVILRVTPRVNPGGLVIMEIEQEVSDVVPTTTSTINSPTIRQRQISSTVAVQSGQSVALGGLIRESRTKSKSGVPLLSEIPIFGSLFSTTTNDTQRTELLVVITPRVVRNEEDARRVTDDLRRRMRRIDFGTLQTSLMGGSDAARQESRQQPAPNELPSPVSTTVPGDRFVPGDGIRGDDRRTAPDETPGTPNVGGSDPGEPGAGGGVVPVPRPDDRRAAMPPASQPEVAPLDLLRPHTISLPGESAARPGRASPPAPDRRAAAGAAAQPPSPPLPRFTLAKAVPEKPADSAKPAEPAASAAATRPSVFYIQAGSFTRMDFAVRRVEHMTEFGPVDLRETEIRGTRYFQVRVGPLASAAVARETLARVVDAGLEDAWLVER